MHLKNTFSTIAILSSLSATLQPTPAHANSSDLSQEFCAQVRQHGERSWQALSVYDAQNPIHGGVNLYFMSKNDRKKAIEKTMVFVQESTKNQVVERRMKAFEDFFNKTDDQRSSDLVRELIKHGTDLVQMQRDTKNCLSP
jgi:hypothetical protein